jgi:hypothetical protein
MPRLHLLEEEASPKIENLQTTVRTRVTVQMLRPMEMS